MVFSCRSRRKQENFHKIQGKCIVIKINLEKISHKHVLELLFFFFKSLVSPQPAYDKHSAVPPGHGMTWQPHKACACMWLLAGLDHTLNAGFPTRPLRAERTGAGEVWEKRFL